MSKKMKVIFTLSFLLNILAVGVLLGGAYKMKSNHPPLGSISEATREILKKNIQADRAEMRRNFRQMQAYKKELRDVIGAEEFDRKIFNAKVNQILAVKGKISARKVETLGKTLSELSQEDRKAFSGHVLGQLLDKHPKGRKGRKSMNKKGNNDR